MCQDLLQLADEAMRLEYNVSKLYMIFRDTYPEDAAFWWELVIEESNHAALFKSGRDYFMSAGAFPEEMLPPALEELQQANQELTAAIEKYQDNPPSREETFNLALQIEMSAGEIHFQNAMTQSTDSNILQMFQKLNQDDKDHSKRIRAYMAGNEIKETG